MNPVKKEIERKLPIRRDNASCKEDPTVIVLVDSKLSMVAWLSEWKISFVFLLSEDGSLLSEKNKLFGTVCIVRPPS